MNRLDRRRPRTLWVLFGIVLLSISANAAPVPFEKDDRVLFYGNSFFERLQEAGLFEAIVQLAHPEKKLQFRSLAWSGDEVGHRLRPEGYVKHLKNLLEQWPADVVFLGFGMNESFADSGGVERFRKDLYEYVAEIKRRHPDARLVLVTPIAVEDLRNSRLPDPSERNRDLAVYSKVMMDFATAQGMAAVDLFKPSLASYAGHRQPLTSNGIHLNTFGNREISIQLARQVLGNHAVVGLDLKRAEKVAAAVARKAAYVATLVRPINAVIYYGVRARPAEYAREMPRYHELVRSADANIHKMAADASKNLDDLETLRLPPLSAGEAGGARHGAGSMVSPSELQKTMKVADGYSVNLFASEEEFPDLKNPVQIAFDNRGRLFVVTMPSFPHTVPGEAHEDKILMLEDTDHDGRADRQTVFADGLNVPDGIAFHEDGVIVSAQPKLIFMKDTDGDGRADVKRELLRGIDVTDAHHGGMIAMDPMGYVMFCDGVFHRSQLETPHGVARGVDATTYRLDLESGRIETEYQTITPNPWKITFDRWGNLFQMYGDGFLQDGHAMPWTPLGIYHPFKRGISIAYGKGSAAAVISSPNFPEEYQQGMATATCLGRYFVALSRHSGEQGYFRADGRLDLLSSRNPTFRPVDLEFGLDGALYVSDFSSPIIGHAQHAMRDPQWDHEHGRIWRVVYQGKPLVKDWAKIDGVADESLLALLKHPQDLVRDHARIQLRSRPGIVHTLDHWVGGMDKTGLDYEEQILEALWIYHSRDEVRADLLDVLLNSEDYRIRAAGTHLIRFQAEQLSDAYGLLRRMSRDPSPRVRLEVISVLSYLQRSHVEWGALLGEIRVDDAPDLKTMIEDASHGRTPALGPEVPIMKVPPESLLTHWLLVGEGGAIKVVKMGKGGQRDIKEGTVRTWVKSEQPRIANLSVRHQHVSASVNGVPVLTASTWWSSDWNVRVELKQGLNLIEVNYSGGKRARGLAPVFLYDGKGERLAGLTVASDEEGLKALAAEAGSAGEADEIRITAVPNRLSFAPREIRVQAGRKMRFVFDNADLMIHNFVLVKPGSANAVGLLADKLALEPDALAKKYIPDTDKIIWSTPLVDAKTKLTLELTVPTEPGRYPFLCTFPGHWRVMRGVMVVEQGL